MWPLFLHGLLVTSQFAVKRHAFQLLSSQFRACVSQVTEYYIYLGDSPQPAKTLDNSTFPWTGHSADPLKYVKFDVCLGDLIGCVDAMCACLCLCLCGFDLTCCMNLLYSSVFQESKTTHQVVDLRNSGWQMFTSGQRADWWCRSLPQWTMCCTSNYIYHSTSGCVLQHIRLPSNCQSPPSTEGKKCIEMHEMNPVQVESTRIAPCVWYCGWCFCI